MFVLSRAGATSSMWPLSTRNVADATAELKI